MDEKMKFVGMRYPKQLLADLDAFKRHLNSYYGERSFTRSDALRIALTEGIRVAGRHIGWWGPRQRTRRRRRQT